MAKVGYFSHYRIEMYSGEGPVPHFHFVDIYDNRIEGCICLNNNSYFNHGPKQATLNSAERKLLVKFLEQTNDVGVTNYKSLCIRWNWSNSHKINKTVFLAVKKKEFSKKILEIIKEKVGNSIGTGDNSLNRTPIV